MSTVVRCVEKPSRERLEACIVLGCGESWMGFFDGSTRWIRRVVVTALVLAVGCGSGDERTPVKRLPGGDGGFADRCTQSEDCESLLCVRVDDSGGICTTTCRTDQGCPAADNWACLATDAVNRDICACRKLDDVERCEDGQDNDCDGRVDDCRVCNGVAVSNDDPAHCGACDNACRSEQRCENQSCVCPEDLPDDCGTCVATSSDTNHCGECGNVCGAGQTCDDGECVCPDEARPSFCENAGCLDLTTDPANCGECGVVCPAAQSCVDGECVCPDGALATYCDGAGCVDAATDSNHCGECNNLCTLATTCSEGECVCPDAAAPDFCDGLGCVDFESNVRHCGDCDEVCRVDQVCREGECACPTGGVECGGACVDLNTTREHCGACDEPCNIAQACIGGECGCTAFGYTVCGDDCANLQTDPAHCGTCDRACRTGEVCFQGNCQCESGVVCDGVCVSSTDPANCGACGQTCPTGQFCSASACFCEAFGLSVCGPECVNLSTDPEHCGSCVNVCRTGETCTNGSCACPTGQTYCETVGRCVNLTNDAGHCGACGSACDPTEICSSSTCRCSTTSQLYCASTNACTDIQSNVAHCGACDDPCNPTEVCRSGVCGCSLTSQRFCATANACVDVVNNSAHCGACNNACPAGTHCANNTCVCDTAGQTLCSGACYDLQTNPEHCGSCTNDCSGNYSCIGGQCRCPTPVTGTAVRLTNNTVDEFRPSAAWDGARVGVAYRRSITATYSNLRLALLNPDGSVAQDIALTDYATGGVIDGPDLIWSGSEYAVVWVQRNTLSTELMFLRLTAEGAPKAAAVPIATDTSVSGPYVPRLAWSVPYAGYAAAYGTFSPTGVTIRRLGADASSPELPNTAPEGSVSFPSFAVAPDGRWASAFTNSSTRFVEFNADGSRTLPISSLSSTTCLVNHHPSVVHDGAAWATAWATGCSTTMIMLNRGTTMNAPVALATATSSTTMGEPLLRMVNGTLAVGWTLRSLTLNSSYQFRFQRFAIPATSSSSVTAIHPAVDILATPNVRDVRNVALVATGSSSMMGVWADDRWGATLEMYAAPINLGACP